MSRHSCVEQWRGVHQQLAASGGTLTIPKSARFSHPRDAGAYVTASWPDGQIADYLLPIGVGLAPLLIREFMDRFEVFSSAMQFTAGIAKMVEANPRLATYVGSALLGGVLGTAITGKREGALLGVGLGLLIAAVLSSRSGSDPLSS